MATLEKIRSRAGLLVIVVGVALFAFVIGDFLRSSTTFFGKSREQVLVVDGNTVNIKDFEAKVKEMEEVYKMNSGSTTLPEDAMTQIRESVFQTMVRDFLLSEEADEIGFTVCKDELSDLVMGENISPVIQQLPMFLNEQRQFDKGAVVRFLKAIETENIENQPAEYQEQLLSAKRYWLFWEQSIKSQRLEEKFNNLISKAIVANSLEAKYDYEANKESVDLNYVMRHFMSIADDKVNVSDADVKALYNERKKTFKQPEDVQVVNYVISDILPSKEDIENVKAEIEKIKPEFVSGTDIASLVNQNSEVPYVNAFLSEAEVRYELKEFVEKANIGDIQEPSYNGTAYSMVKLVDKIVAADSIQINQIMVSAPNDSAMTKLTDSLMAVVNGGVSFADMAKSATNGRTDGSMGWTTEARLVRDADEKFAKSVFDAPLNKVFIVESSHGKHLVQVTARTKPVTKYKLAEIQVKVTPSTDTYKKLYTDMAQYIAGHTVPDSLCSGAAEKGYRCYDGMFVRKADQNIQGALKSRTVVRWAFDHKPGTISDIFECEGKYVVAGVLRSVKKGYQEYEDVAEMLRKELVNDKKAEMIIAEAKSSQTMAQYSQAFNTTIQPVSFVSFGTSNLSGIGREPMVNAKALTTEVGKISAPFKGTNGVYVIEVTSKKENNKEFNVDSYKETITSANSYKAAYQVMNTLRDKADIKDNRINFY